ncbi:hypothetical protein EKH77_27005 [Streptomyces luteoverticillatus]|uniref:Uncharacterized protein n=1 Tax=Streptomyces luteoverticillatus TaxID=66425 RepID=A0A3S9PPW8_STRLT|nr:hypothetical protein [Streptomyces luteoverticillatus]AZQ74374.1 hypothetical protein EKH77_27005 [Streptomyces luteoverticillatus]
MAEQVDRTDSLNDGERYLYDGQGLRVGKVGPERIGTPVIEYRDGVPVVSVRGGSFIPAAMVVVNPDNYAVALYDLRVGTTEATSPSGSDFAFWDVQQDDTATDPTSAPTELVPAPDAKPEDVSALGLRYAEGRPEVLVSGGRGVLPVELTVVNGSGNTVAAYTASSAANQPDRASRGLLDGVVDYLPSPAFLPADQVNPEDLGALSLHYVDGQPVLVVSGGKYAPAVLPVVNGARFSRPSASGIDGSVTSALSINFFVASPVDLSSPGSLPERTLNLQAGSIISGVVVDIDYPVRW